LRPNAGARRSGLVVLVVEVVVVVELDAIFGCELRVLVVLSGRGTRRIGVRSTEGAERLRAGLLELAGLFEAPVATLLHGRAPRADATMGSPV
jgi:D-serine deaminase-like pyridoxal phosphate-dependent protein